MNTILPVPEASPAESPPAARPEDTPVTLIPVWRESRARQLAARIAYPLVWLLNRPSAAGISRALYDVALRCNGIAINYKGRHGLTLPEERFLARIAPSLKGGTVLDVGANTGSYALELRRLAPQARIIAFEPHPRTFATLTRRLEGSGIETQKLALGDIAGSMKLYDFAGDDGSTQASLSRASVGLYTREVVEHEIVCETLDNFLDNHDIAMVDFLKVDTEGFDLKVLQGARRAIAARRIRLIQFEFIAANIATSVRMRDFFDLLAGYQLSRMCLNGEELSIDPYSVKYNEIYVNQNLVARPA